MARDLRAREVHARCVPRESVARRSTPTSAKVGPKAVAPAVPAAGRARKESKQRIPGLPGHSMRHVPTPVARAGLRLLITDPPISASRLTSLTARSVWGRRVGEGMAIPLFAHSRNNHHSAPGYSAPSLRIVM